MQRGRPKGRSLLFYLPRLRARLILFGSDRIRPNASLLRSGLPNGDLDEDRRVLTGGALVVAPVGLGREMPTPDHEHSAALRHQAEIETLFRLTGTVR